MLKLNKILQILNIARQNSEFLLWEYNKLTGGDNEGELQLELRHHFDLKKNLM